MAGKSVPDGEESPFTLVTTCRNIKKPAATARRKDRPGLLAGAHQSVHLPVQIKRASEVWSWDIEARYSKCPCPQPGVFPERRDPAEPRGSAFLRPRPRARIRTAAAQPQLQPVTAARV